MTSSSRHQSELTVAVAGCKEIGQLHMRCWAILSGARITAVFDEDGDAAAKAAAQTGAAAFTDYGAMLRGGTFDIIDVCAELDQRHPIAEAALQAGANVIVEAPSTGDPLRARGLAALATSRERLVMPTFSLRLHPLLVFARELVEDDHLGSLTMFRCRVGSPVTSGRNGVLLDGALHGIDLFRAFCGEVRHISGRTTSVMSAEGNANYAAIALQSDHVIGTVEATANPADRRTVVELTGTAGACIVDFEQATARYITADQPVWQTRDEGGPGRNERALAHFADAVRGLQPLLITADDGARAVELCQEVALQNP